MQYENLASFAQSWGTIYAIVVFLAAVVYALWPRNAETFKRAAQMPLDEENEQ
jgi:cytochrome c oxidase cbb3-type subunit 4